MKVLFATVKGLVAVLAIVLMVPVLLLVGIALGPAALVIVFVIGCALPVLLVERARERHTRGTWVPTLHR
jgi:hypothetical protein